MPIRINTILTRSTPGVDLSCLFLCSTFPNLCSHDAHSVGVRIPVSHVPFGLQSLESALCHLAGDVPAAAYAEKFVRTAKDGVHLLCAPDVPGL